MENPVGVAGKPHRQVGPVTRAANPVMARKVTASLNCCTNIYNVCQQSIQPCHRAGRRVTQSVIHLSWILNPKLLTCRRCLLKMVTPRGLNVSVLVAGNITGTVNRTTPLMDAQRVYLRCEFYKMAEGEGCHFGFSASGFGKDGN